MINPAEEVDVNAVQAAIERGARQELAEQLQRHGAAAFEDAAIFEDVEAALRRACAQQSRRRGLLLPELLGDESSWRLNTGLPWSSHRGRLLGGMILAVKRRLIAPAVRWLVEYATVNFTRQQRVNLALFACVQELAIQNARLRRDLNALKGDT